MIHDSQLPPQVQQPLQPQLQPQLQQPYELKTEAPNTKHENLDAYATPQLVQAIIDDQINAVAAVQAAQTDLSRAVDLAAHRLGRGGRLIYVGAGTSGRLGLLDSVELYPTFSWPRERAIAILAGGNTAIYEAVEGAEDNLAQGELDLRAAHVQANDVVIVLAASGTTPYALGALAEAKRAGALTIGVANNPNTPVSQLADIGITLDTGSEVISGSTRLKAGTAQKILLNTFSSAVMVRLSKVYGNLMVDLQATNAKLVKRSIKLTMLATGADEYVAASTLERCNYSVKVAIVSLIKKVSIDESRIRLNTANGNVRRALESN